ncbi:hypothetical protein C8R44DRAFT_726674 [Mycena epipterygia]|nr:hypothetical protein C8R44DRAFT_726674 [Mycena epipterygia]
MPASESPAPSIHCHIAVQKTPVHILHWGTRHMCLWQFYMVYITRSAEHPAKTQPPNCKGCLDFRAWRGVDAMSTGACPQMHGGSTRVQHMEVLLDPVEVDQRQGGAGQHRGRGGRRHRCSVLRTQHESDLTQHKLRAAWIQSALDAMRAELDSMHASRVGRNREGTGGDRQAA